MIPGLFLVRAIQTTPLVRTPAFRGRGWKTGASGPGGVPQATSKLPGGECEQLPFLPTPLSAPFSTPDTSPWLAANLLPVLITVNAETPEIPGSGWSHFHYPLAKERLRTHPGPWAVALLQLCPLRACSRRLWDAAAHPQWVPQSQLPV